MDVFFCKLFYSSTFICLAEEVGHIGNAGVFCEWVIMVQLQYFTLHVVVFRELNLGKACQW